MVKKTTEKSSLAHHAPYITFVAVVAVIAVVVLVMNFMKAPQVVTEEGEAIVGEALRTPTAAGVNVCKEGERCGFVTKDEVTKMITDSTGEKQVFVFNPDIAAFYNGKYDWQKTSGEEVCKDMGYSGCFTAEFSISTRFHSSVDGSCSGNIQLMQEQEVTIPCHWSSKEFWASKADFCETAKVGVDLLELHEPEKGDRIFSRHLINVICIE